MLFRSVSLRITAAAGTELAGAYSDGTFKPRTRRGYYSHPKAVYNPEAFILHAASLRQAFAHCAIFLTAALRGGLGSVSVPMWRANLSVPLPVVALVGRYLTN